MEKVINGYHLYIETKVHDAMILWIMGEHEKQYLDLLQKQLPCSLVAFQCQNWNQELSPWKADGLWENQDFAGKGAQTYEMIVDEIIPYLQVHFHYHKLYIVGYSLAGLFSLFAMVKSDLFAGSASCSGSLWYEGFEAFVYDHPCHDRRIYHFLRTANESCFRYEPGNHFHQPQLRLLHAMQWLIQEGK